MTITKPASSTFKDRHSSIYNHLFDDEIFSHLRQRIGLMTQLRKALISLADTPYYHITPRCERRAYLFGIDHYSDQSYERR